MCSALSLDVVHVVSLYMLKHSSVLRLLPSLETHPVTPRSDLLKTVTAFFSSVDFLFFDFLSVMVFIFNKAPVLRFLYLEKPQWLRFLWAFSHSAVFFF